MVNWKGGDRLRATYLKSSSSLIAFLILCALWLTRNSFINPIDIQGHGLKSAGEVTIIKPVEQIILLGERHSGTNWITSYLRECFQTDELKVINTYADWKHWFQEEEDSLKVTKDSALVVVMFRDPYAWVEAMRVLPHHAHGHINMPDSVDERKKDSSWRRQGGRALDWHEFVTRPWIGDTKKTKDIHGLGENFYELQFDGSDRAYSSIIDLRRDKIINHLSVANFPGTRALLPMRFEDLNMNGTSQLLESIEREGGLMANCSAIVGKAGRDRRQLKKVTKHKELSQDFIDWMNKYVDWEVENRIGYYKRS